MPIASKTPVVSAEERRRSRTAGDSLDMLKREAGSSLFTAIVPDESGLMGSGGFGGNTTAITSGTARFLYLGRSTGRRLDFCGVVVTVAGTGTPSAVVGFATTDAGPDFTLKTLTVAAVQPIDTVNGGLGRVSNTVQLTYTPTVGTHLWAFCLMQNSLTQPTLYNYSNLGAGAVTPGRFQVSVGQSVAACVAGKQYTAVSTTSIAPRLFVS